MRIALISPRGAFFSNEPRLMQFWEGLKTQSRSKLLALQFNLWSGFNLGLLTLAALTPKEAKIKFIDENFNSIDFEEDYDLVGISAMTQQAVRAYQIADEFRRRGIKIVMGGIHPTVLPFEAKKHADSIIIGEGEELWPQFLQDFLKNEIKIFYKTQHSFNMNKSPIPRFDLLNPLDYKIVCIQTSRGCPYDCEFCASSKIFGVKFRHKRVEQVIKEVKIVKNIWRNTQINFSDDNMFIDRKYALSLVEKLIPLKVRWFAQTDISIAQDERFLKLLKESGCTILFIGFETLSKEGLQTIDKHQWKYRQFKNYSFSIKKIQSYGIGVLGAFIVGLDSDDASIFKKTADFIIDNKLYAAQITVLTPMPGTRLRERLEKEKRIFSNNWDKYSFIDVNFIPKQISKEELEAGLLEIYQRVYSRENRLKVANHFKKIYADLTKLT